MSITGENSIFIAMKQDGPFAVSDELNDGNLFNAFSRAWIQRFASQPVTLTKYRAVRTQVFELLQVSHYREISHLIADRESTLRRAERAYQLLGNLYGIEGSLAEIKKRIHEYAVSADEVIT